MKKNWKKMLLKAAAPLSAIALMVTAMSVNTCCAWMGYQPELPENAKKLRKF